MANILQLHLNNSDKNEVDRKLMIILQWYQCF